MEKNYYNEFDKMEFVGLLSQRGNEVLPKLQEIADKNPGIIDSILMETLLIAIHWHSDFVLAELGKTDYDYNQICNAARINGMLHPIDRKELSEILGSHGICDASSIYSYDGDNS